MMPSKSSQFWHKSWTKSTTYYKPRNTVKRNLHNTVKHTKCRLSPQLKSAIAERETDREIQEQFRNLRLWEIPQQSIIVILLTSKCTITHGLEIDPSLESPMQSGSGFTRPSDCISTTTTSPARTPSDAKFSSDEFSQHHHLWHCWSWGCAFDEKQDDFVGAVPNDDDEVMKCSIVCLCQKILQLLLRNVTDVAPTSHSKQSRQLLAQNVKSNFNRNLLPGTQP